MIQQARDPRGAGFTLVEMLVALAVAGLVSLILMHGIGLAGRGLERLSQRAGQLDERRSLDFVMRRALGAVVAIPVLDGKPGFVGQGTSISFLSTVEDGGPGLYRIRLALDATGRQPAVVLTRRLAAPSALPRGDESVLVRSVRGLAISYFGANSPGAAPAWRQDWTGMTDLPLLVRIILDAGDGGEQQPPIVLRLRDAG
jgi:general secretion pathway protein J